MIVAVSGASARPQPSTAHTARWLLPNTVSFVDQKHGVLGTGDRDTRRTGGAIELTSDGGRTWTVVRRTPRPVVTITPAGSFLYAQLDDGETLQSTNHGETWRLWSGAGYGTGESACPIGYDVGTNAGDSSWSLCTTQAGVGFQGKAVYRNLNHGWKRVACTNFMDSRFPCGKHQSGGISSMGYPDGIAGGYGDFAILWPGGRGIVYVTRDGGHNWHGAPIVESDADSGMWATTVRTTGWVLVYSGGNRRLFETTDAGRTWRVVSRWLY
jgi:photosystem II stability/assembly factor-like uncharacterized protein